VPGCLLRYLAADGFLGYGWLSGHDEIVVEHLTAASAAATRALWGVVASHSSVADTVRAHVGPSDPFWWLLREQEASIAGHRSWMLRLLDAPVSGGEQGAIEGVLSIMVGGAAEDFEAAAPVFDAVGKTIVHVGPAGSGQTVKAANQLMVAGHLELLAEAIVFLEAYGVDTEAALRVLGGGLAGSTVLQRKGATMLARDFKPGFRIALHDKDMGIVTAAAREAGVVIPLGAVAAQLVASLKAQGDGGLDHSALLKLVTQLSGRDEE